MGQPQVVKAVHGDLQLPTDLDYVGVGTGLECEPFSEGLAGVLGHDDVEFTVPRHVHQLLHPRHALHRLQVLDFPLEGLLITSHFLDNSKGTIFGLI